MSLSSFYKTPPDNSIQFYPAVQNPYITDEPYGYATEETIVEEEYDEPTTPAVTSEPIPRLPDFVTEPLNPTDLPTTVVPPYDIPITYVGDYTTVDDHLTRHQYEGVTRSDLPEFTQMPNVCSGGFDAVGVLRGEVFIFKGAYLWRLTEKYRIREGYPVRIWQVFRGFPREVQRIDAVYEREFDNAVVLFSGEFLRQRVNVRGFLKSSSATGEQKLQNYAGQHQPRQLLSVIVQLRQ